MFVTVERVMENSRSISRWYTGSFFVPVEVAHDPVVHGGHVVHVVLPVELVDLAEDQVVHPAHLCRDDLRRLPWGVAAGLFVAFIVHNGFPFELFVTGLFSLELFDAVQYHNARFDHCQ